MERLGTSGNRGVGDMERMAVAARTLTQTSERLTTALRENARLSAEIARANEAAARAAAGGGGRGGGAGPGGAGGHRRGSGRGFGGHDFMLTGMGASMVGEPLVRGGETAFERGMEVAHLRTQILADRRVSEKQADALIAKAYEATASAPGTRVAANLHAAIDLKQVTGSLEEAEALLPRFAQLTALLQVMDRRRGGTGDSAFAAAKAMELMGGMVDEHQDASGHTVREINPELMQKRLDMIARVAVATNARVTPQDYLAFAKQARVAGMTLSDEFIYERLPAIMLGMGGARAGTAFMSMAQVFEGGKLTAKSMEALQEIGLAGPEGLSAEAKRRGRDGKMVSTMAVHPEAIYDLALMRTDPDKWVAKAQARMEAKNIHGTDNQIVALMRASQRSTIAGALADLLKDAVVIAKEQDNIRATRPDIASYFAQQDPAAKVQQMQAAFDKLVTTLGSAVMDDAVRLLNAATNGLNSLSDWSRRNPDLARILTETAVGLGVVATAVGTLSTAIFLFGPALKLLGGGGAGAAAGAAGGAGGAIGGGLSGPGSGLGLGWLQMHPEVMKENLDQQRAIIDRERKGPHVAPQVPSTGPVFGPQRPGDPSQAPGLLQRQGYLAPVPSGQSGGVQTAAVYLDGQKVGRILVAHMVRDGSGPSKGITGFDPRAGFVGGMQGITA